MISWLASPPPDAAVEISAERVSVATLAPRGGSLVVQAYASEPLPPDAVMPSLTGRNVANAGATAIALKTACDRAGVRPKRVGLVIPDVAARVSIVRFDKVPPRAEDLDQLVRWQLRKAAPFPVEDACVTYSPGLRGADGTDYIAVMARRAVVEEYEGICAAVGAHAGLVDLATLSVLNLFGSAAPATGDWLIVHMRPTYTSLAVLRGEHVIFYRNRPEDEEDSLADLVHQTTMYYEDRLSGEGFARVLLGGVGRVVGAVDLARASLEERLGVRVEPIDPTQTAALTDRIAAPADVMDLLAPLVGLLVRTRQEALTA
jgi:Tfp pilus assembly PilM family ATPase